MKVKKKTTTKYCFVDHLFPRFLTKDIVRDLNHTVNYLYIVTFHAWISSTQKAITLSSLQEEDRRQKQFVFFLNFIQITAYYMFYKIVKE